MFAHDAIALDQRIDHLSKIRSALALVLGEIDAELTPLKKARNARQSIGRLPIEIFVRILRLSQMRNSRALSVYNVLPRATWWKIMSVSTHFRSMIVSSPTLWAAFDSRWPRTWSQLCIKRAEGCLLKVFIHVDSKSHAGVACRLLPRSEHAALHFRPHGATPGWDQSYIETLQADCPALLSLKLQHQWQDASLLLSPPLLTLCTALSYLDVALASITVEDTFSFPSSLRHLRITTLLISTHTDRLRRLFAGMPLLEEFEIHDIGDMHDTAFTNIDTLELKIEPLVLPALSSLALHLHDAPVQFAYTISQILGVPKCALEIFLFANASETPLSAEEAAAEWMMIHNLFDYTQRFWTRADRCSQLPSATLFDHGTGGYDMSYLYHVEIQSNHPAVGAGASLCFHVASDLPPPSDVFLPLVTRFEVIASDNEDRPFLGADNWPPPGSLPALETLCVKLYDVWQPVPKIQKWVDMHAQHPIVVHIIHVMGGDDGDISLQWRTDCGPLKEVYWSAYKAGEIPRSLLPESDNNGYQREDVAWDGEDIN
jgi:hypothetical protein